MLPSVAHRSPFFTHHHLDHPPAEQPVFDTSALALRAALRQHQLDKYASEQQNATLRTPMQFPTPSLHQHATTQLPIGNSVAKGPSSASASASASGAASSSASFSSTTISKEHALRRKTPNGTLTAGYDGTPGDQSVQPPATKHVLVSLDSGPSLLPNANVPPDNAWRLNGRTLAAAAAQPGPEIQYPTYPSFNTYDVNNRGGLPHNNGTGWMRPVKYGPGMDSVLNQTPQQLLPQQPQQQQYFLPNVPTVLPSVLQSSLGPTAPAGVGPYGPYWPDGAYIPYRPAAFRDSRFPPSPSFISLNGTRKDPSVYGGVPSLFDRPDMIPQQPFGWNGNPLAPPHAPPGIHSHAFTPDSSLLGAQQLWDQPHALAYHTRQLHASTPHPSIGNSGPAASSVGWHDPRTGPSQMLNSLDAIDRPRNAEFREKVLAWAHGVYIDLLAYLHRARRNNNGISGVQDARVLAKPNIFPRPPRQPASDFSSSQSNFSISGHRPEIAAADNHHFNAYRSSRNPISCAHRLLSGGSLSPVENAVTALEILSNLCQESRWDWIDGMLVGGCLAYGLEDYEKAMRWYSRILDRDSSHVEALSNLAATLLALDRHEEAHRHWLRAVALRPNYFEAVEHLIGLLCRSQRAKEAVEVIEYVEKSLKLPARGQCFKQSAAPGSESESEASSDATAESFDRVSFDYDADASSPPSTYRLAHAPEKSIPGFGSSGYSIPGADNGRMLALIHAKGNMLYALGKISDAAAAFESAVLIAAGRTRYGMQRLIRKIVAAFSDESSSDLRQTASTTIVLLYPEKALQTAKLIFRPSGNLPGLKHVVNGTSKRAAISTASNSLLSLAKIYQDGMVSAPVLGPAKTVIGVGDILALYYLSFSLHPSPSTANNVGILLASIQQNGSTKIVRSTPGTQYPNLPGVIPGSGISLALAYYNHGLQLDAKHAHLYTNLGSLLKDIGQLPAAIRMYEQAVQCDGKFDIALANLANALKDSGRINDAIIYYRRAVAANPDFAEAVCGLANALNSVCNWIGRGGIASGRGSRDRWHIDDNGRLVDGRMQSVSFGWIKRVVDIVDRQLQDGQFWGCGVLGPRPVEQLKINLLSRNADGVMVSKNAQLDALLRSWSGKPWEGSRVVKLVERAIRYIGWQWYHDRYVRRREYPLAKYARPVLPEGLSTPNAPTVLPFHTFTCPLSAKQIRHISQRNGLRISASTLRAPWLPATVYPPPPPPNPCLNVGYVSSDFNNHPLAHLMQSVFGLHDQSRVRAFCYATTPTDNSVHRRQIEKEAPVFRDVSNWPVNRLIEQIVADGIHILVNLNGYTRGARNEVFAARPAPIHMSFMGFAGTLGAEWCDYILSDQISIPPETLCPQGRNLSLEQQVLEEDHAEDAEDWVYGEKIAYTKHTFFCCDHRQSASDASERHMSWDEEQVRRWRMRKETFPNLPDNAIILGNFNQLYKIDPTTFRSWLRILSQLPNAILWLLRFPDLGEQNLRHLAVQWAGERTASRIFFTDVAPKYLHISRARVCDLFLDTPECNAHTTAADILWSGTPLLTFPRYRYKMCSRMASSILTSALPQTDAGRQAASELIASSDAEYEQRAIALGRTLQYIPGGNGLAIGRLAELRQMLYTNRGRSKLFDTRRWVRDLEGAYEAVWWRWERGEESDVWMAPGMALGSGWMN